MDNLRPFVDGKHFAVQKYVLKKGSPRNIFLKRVRKKDRKRCALDEGVSKSLITFVALRKGWHVGTYSHW